MSEHVSIHPAARIGSVYLKVRDLDRSVAFYREVIGLSVLEAKRKRSRTHGRRENTAVVPGS